MTAEGAGALLFYGYYDQTDIFFKMAKALTLNTQSLDQAVNLKLNSDVPYFQPASQLRNGLSSEKLQILTNAPLVTPRLLSDDERYGQDEDHDH